MSLLQHAGKLIRVLLVDDSPLVLMVLNRMLGQSPEIHIVGQARNGQEALELIPSLKPDVICTDYQMPIMDGLEFTKAVMAKYPCPILVISSIVGADNKDNIFALLEAGAVDVFPKPSGGLGPDDEAAQQIISKIKILSGVVVFKRFSRSLSTPVPSTTAVIPTSAKAASARVIAIGASTGGPAALFEVLTQLPANFPFPVLCVQHISHGFLQGLVDWLDAHCQVKVKIARSGETPLPGFVYFPEEETHLTVDKKGRLVSSHQMAVGGHRPSATVLFNSVAEYSGDSAIAVLLTGMGNDGAEGITNIAKAGGVTFAQNEASCVVYGMPKQAIESGFVRFILPPREIGQSLARLATSDVMAEKN